MTEIDQSLISQLKRVLKLLEDAEMQVGREAEACVSEAYNRLFELLDEAENGNQQTMPDTDDGSALGRAYKRGFDHGLLAAPVQQSIDGTDWEIIEENGKKYVKVELNVMADYRARMEGKATESSQQSGDAEAVQQEYYRRGWKDAEQHYAEYAGEEPTESPDVVERVAVALWRKQQDMDGYHETSGFEVLAIGSQNEYRELAKAAIGAMGQSEIRDAATLSPVKSDSASSRPGAVEPLGFPGGCHSAADEVGAAGSSELLSREERRQKTCAAPTKEQPVHTPPPKLVKAVIQSITDLAALKPEEIDEQGEIGFFELLDMSLTLIEALKATERESIDLSDGEKDDAVQVMYDTMKSYWRSKGCSFTGRGMTRPELHIVLAALLRWLENRRKS